MTVPLNSFPGFNTFPSPTSNPTIAQVNANPIQKAIVDAREQKIEDAGYDVNRSSGEITWEDITVQDFTPTISNRVNLASLTLGRCSYFRIGDWLQVIGSFAFVPTDSFADMSFDMTPPVEGVMQDSDVIATLAGWTPSTSFPSSVLTQYYSNPGIDKAAGTVPFQYWVRRPQ